ncbi:MAG: hemolysin family protein [Zhaonellaceae bacterium]|jgi:putative hemolysin|nr:HlyC/CorC family transporter [Clostridia bacterium]
MPKIGLEIVVILLLIIANGIFSMTEIAIVSARKARLKKQAEEGNKGAQVALRLAGNSTQLISTVQVGITLIGIFTGAFGGATLAEPLSKLLVSFPRLAPYSYGISLAIVVGLITYLSLIIGELVPKKLALNSPEAIAARLARPMQFFAKLVNPFVQVLVISTNFVLKLLRVKPSEEPEVTEEEVRILIRQGAESGTFLKQEEDLVEQVFRLGDLRANALMVPRTQVEWLDLEDSLEYNLSIVNQSTHSRFPVARGSLDDLVGFVYTRDLCSCVLRKGEINLEDLARPPLLIPKSMKVFKVLELFQQKGLHEAIVIDEYGGVFGLLTLHDILEELVGEMPLFYEQEEPEVVVREDGSYLLDGMLAIDEFKDIFSISELPAEGEDEYLTLGGFVMSYLGYIPSVGEVFEWNKLRLEIVDMDGARVDKVLVSRIS